MRQATTARQVMPSPIFVAIAGAFVFGGWVAWTGTGTTARVGVFVFVAAGWVVSLCLHEFAHAYLAWRSGDHGVAMRGYLTLNPLKYSNAMLSFVLPMLFVLLGGIGLPGGAVYVNRGAISGRRRHSLISAAGPLANVVFAIALGLIVSRLAETGHVAFWAGAAFLAYLQVTAALLNLLPVPGLDGYGIVEPFLPHGWVRLAEQVGQYGLLLVMGVLWLPPVNTAFFEGVLYLCDALGLDTLLIGYGYTLFRFWIG